MPDKALITDEDVELEDIELIILLEAIYLRYGYDFRSYTKASLKRRVLARMEKDGFSNITQIVEKIMHDEVYFHDFLAGMTINVTEMFRDPGFYAAFRKEVIPELRSHPFVKIWHAGCATGEEVYSMAILLQEEGLHGRVRQYATDIDKAVLAQAKKGIFPASALKQYTQNYMKAGGKESLSDYYTARYEHVIMDSSLKENIVFADHDLATDQVFGEMQVVICRNVLIYFNRELQGRVFSLFDQSLDIGGFICLGTQETMKFSGCDSAYENIAGNWKIYKKKFGTGS